MRAFPSRYSHSSINNFSSLKTVNQSESVLVPNLLLDQKSLGETYVTSIRPPSPISERLLCDTKHTFRLSGIPKITNVLDIAVGTL